MEIWVNSNYYLFIFYLLFKYYIYSLTEYVLKYALQSIPLKQKAQYFNTKYVENEFQNLSKFVDDDTAHINCLNKGYNLLDRYSDIKTYEHNRIIIHNELEYINASPINIISNKYFISTQGPKNQTIDDFWRMIDEHKCNVIVMLCNLKEGGSEKCANYWDNNNLKNYSIIDVKETKENENIIIRDIKFMNESKTEKSVKQIHFIGWPDKGVPNLDDGKIFETFLRMIKLTDKYRKNGPIVAHCSAGVGRTGTYIAMYYLEKEITRQIEDKVDIIKFSIFNLVRKLKEMRMYLVQNYLQYNFIYQFVYHLLVTYNI